MLAEGDMVAVRFERSAEIEGKPVKVDVMQFLRISDGVIAEVWETYNPEQIASQTE